MENEKGSEAKSRDERHAEKRAYRRARTTVGLRIGFFFHLFVYVVTNLLLFTINLLFTPLVWWVMIPVVAWGIALALHGAAVLIFSGSGMRRTMLKAELEKELGKAKTNDRA